MKVLQYFQKYCRIGSLDLKVQVLLQKSQTYFKVPERYLPRCLSILSPLPSALPPALSCLFFLSCWVLDYEFVSSSGLSFVSMSMSYLNRYALQKSHFIFSAYQLLPIGKAEKMILSDSHYRFRSSHGFS